MLFISPAFARAELADAARQAEVEALALLGSEASAHDALVALAIATAQRVQQRDIIALPYSAWMRLVEFLACDLAYEPTPTFPYSKWQLMTAWWMPREEGSKFELDTARPDRVVSLPGADRLAGLGIHSLRAEPDDAEGSPAAAMAGERAGDC